MPVVAFYLAILDAPYDYIYPEGFLDLPHQDERRNLMKDKWTINQSIAAGSVFTIVKARDPHLSPRLHVGSLELAKSGAPPTTGSERRDWAVFQTKSIKTSLCNMQHIIWDRRLLFLLLFLSRPAIPEAIDSFAEGGRNGAGGRKRTRKRTTKNGFVAVAKWR